MVCNCCGKEIEERKQDYIYIEKEWNYFMYGNRTRPISCSIFSRN